VQPPVPAPLSGSHRVVVQSPIAKRAACSNPIWRILRAHGDRQRGQQVCYASIVRAWAHTSVTRSWQRQSDSVLGRSRVPSRRSRPEGLVRAAARTTAPGTTSASDGVTSVCRPDVPTDSNGSSRASSHRDAHMHTSTRSALPAAAAITAPASTTISSAALPLPAGRSAARHAADDEPVGGGTAVRLNDAPFPRLQRDKTIHLWQTRGWRLHGCRKEESSAARAENPLLQQRPAQPMIPSASRA
jgi:hypothetical protein